MSDRPKKKCFVIAPIGEDGSEIREHSDTVLECIINPVIEPLGFEQGQRADHLGEPGVITRQIVKRIAEDELVIADLSRHNPNVFYELAIRHASGKPFIQMITKGEKIPFDVGQQRTIPFDPKNLRDAEKAKAELRKQVEACLRDGFTMETPLGYAFDIASLQKGSPVERSLSVIVEKLEELQRRIPRSLMGDPIVLLDSALYDGKPLGRAYGEAHTQPSLLTGLLANKTREHTLAVLRHAQASLLEQLRESDAKKATEEAQAPRRAGSQGDEK